MEKNGFCAIEHFVALPDFSDNFVNNTSNNFYHWLNKHANCKMYDESTFL